MPAQVVVVLQDSVALNAVACAIRSNGHTVQPFVDPLRALSALEQAHKVELLITCVSFVTGKGNGRSLVLMTRMKRPDVKCIFLVQPGEDHHVRDLGECLPLPVDVPRLAQLAEAMLVPAPAVGTDQGARLGLD